MSESVPGIPHDPLNRSMPGSLHRRRALVKGEFDIYRRRE
ncbi:4543_t:CDS:2 [Paraglomus occultum]|uniref:4543_t:CDS:1 n=1 Tax=Paraglomus occultum TaxID=144539 RepID=A0A9N9FRI1_9GLOM|nr:4543_t:CDS:2 [Paraglomus occultum]